MQTFILALLTLFPAFAWSQQIPVHDVCTRTCAIHADCGVGGLCDQGRCLYQRQFCFNERWSVNERGETSNCDGYACADSTGLCLREAQSSLDCLSGFVFDGQSNCVPSVQCNLADPVCQSLYERWKKARADYEEHTPEPHLPALTCQPCSDSITCGAGKMCWQDRCENQGSYCSIKSQDEAISIAPSGEVTACGAYACEKVTGQCFRNCLKNSDCRNGKVCMVGACL